MEYMTAANSRAMFILCLISILTVLAMAVLFMRTAWKEGTRIGMKKSEMRQIIGGSAFFSIIPSIAVLLMLTGLTFLLGKYFPWLRLSVIGSGIYETMAANMSLTSFGLKEFSQASLSNFVGIMFVMTIGILAGPIMNILFLKKYDSILKGRPGKENPFVPILLDAMFIGILVEWLAPGLLNFQNPQGIAAMTAGLAAMLICTKIEKTAKGRKLQNFSMSISMIIGMLAAIIYSHIIQ